MSEPATTLVRAEPRPLLSWTDEEIKLIRDMFAKGATDAEFKIFLYVARTRNLDPLKKQIYFRKDKKGNVTHITSIDGYRVTAARTGEYAGSDDAAFDSQVNPLRATATVYRLVKGIRCSFTATARWSEYYPGDSQWSLWGKMPCTMLAKCAEALALRKAFPEELGGLYTKEEMDQARAEEERGEEAASKGPPPQPVDVEASPAPQPPPKRGGTYNSSRKADQERLKGILVKRAVPEDLWGDISDAMEGKTEDDLPGIIEAALAAAMERTFAPSK